MLLYVSFEAIEARWGYSTTSGALWAALRAAGAGPSA